MWFISVYYKSMKDLPSNVEDSRTLRNTLLVCLSKRPLIILQREMLFKNLRSFLKTGMYRPFINTAFLVVVSRLSTQWLQIVHASQGRSEKNVWNSSFSETALSSIASKNHWDKQHHLHWEDVKSHPKCQRILNSRVSLEVQTKPLHYTLHIPGFLEIEIGH